MAKNEHGKAAQRMEPKGSEGIAVEAVLPEAELKVGKSAKIWFAVVVVVVLVAVFGPRGDGTTTAPGGFLLDENGRPTTLGNHMTPVVLLHFWATWCPPCITEIPALQRLADDYRHRAGFQVMMIAVDDEIEKVRPFVGDRAFSVLYDPEWNIAHRYGTRKLPETYLVVNGKVLNDYKYIGATNWDDPKIRADLEEILDEVLDGGEGARRSAG
jgi:thiol-disulfide isomerase/thioredoxin